MMVLRAPPDSLCRLPGPWQLSHPTFFACSPLAIRRAWVAVGKCLFTSLWHSAHVSEPTNVAPGISGGTNNVRCTLTHEIIARSGTRAITMAPIFKNPFLLPEHTPRDFTWAWFFIACTDTVVEGLQNTPVKARNRRAAPRSAAEWHESKITLS